MDPSKNQFSRVTCRPDACGPAAASSKAHSFRTLSTHTLSYPVRAHRVGGQIICLETILRNPHTGRRGGAVGGGGPHTAIAAAAPRMTTVRTPRADRSHDLVSSSIILMRTKRRPPPMTRSDPYSLLCARSLQNPVYYVLVLL